MTPLQMATTDELIEELAARHKTLVLLLANDSPSGPRQYLSRRVIRGQGHSARGLVAHAAAAMDFDDIHDNASDCDDKGRPL